LRKGNQIRTPKPSIVSLLQSPSTPSHPDHSPHPRIPRSPSFALDVNRQSPALLANPFFALCIVRLPHGHLPVDIHSFAAPHRPRCIHWLSNKPKHHANNALAHGRKLQLRAVIQDSSSRGEMDFGPPGTSVTSHAHHHHYNQHHQQSHQHLPVSNHHAPHTPHGYPTPGQHYSSLPADSGAPSTAPQHHGNSAYHVNSSNSNNPMPSPAPSSTTSPQLNTASTYYSTGDSRSAVPSSATTSSPALGAHGMHGGAPLSSHPMQSHSTDTSPQQSYPHYIPSDRTLPSRDAGENPNATDEENDKAFEDAYVQFVLYCNPTFSVSATDTLDLRKNFSSPPKSDGKSFNTRVLYDLLRKFYDKVIKTWTELALELGVQRPAVDQGQSSQKVQQYSVRLKVCSPNLLE
jgi:ARS binding protein 2